METALLTTAQLEALGNIVPVSDQLSRDLVKLAERVHATDGVDREFAWHHLLLAVANFKSERKVLLSPLPVVNQLRPGTNGGVTVPIPEGVLTITAEDPATWGALSDAISGLGVARASTVLAALWPARHAIIDRRSLWAAFALAGPVSGWKPPLPDPDATTGGQIDWPRYGWYRDRVLATASAIQGAPVDVERGLYQLGRRLGTESGRTWLSYATEANSKLEKLVESLAHEPVIPSGVAEAVSRTTQ